MSERTPAPPNPPDDSEESAVDWQTSPFDPEALWRSIIESADDAIISKTLDGIVTTWNPAATKLFGYTAAEMIGRPVTLLIPSDHLDEEPSILARVSRGERIDHYRTQRLTKDGRTIEVSLSISPVRNKDGKVAGASKIVRDMSGRLRLEQAEIAESMWHSLVESADDAIITKDLNGVVTSWNHGAERVFGYKAEEMIGKPIVILIPPDHSDEEPRILDRIRRGERIDHYETKRLRKSGRIIDISLTVSPVRDSSGVIIGASKIARDITERKRLEALDRNAKQAAEQLNRAKDEFIATISHELRTPMTAILGWVRMLATGELNRPAQKKAVQVIERNARSQAQLIEDLLDVSRIISGKLRLRVQLLNPTSVIANAIESLRPAAESKSIRIQMMIDSGIKSLRGDEERLRQVVWNLLSNALKFTPIGGNIQISLDRTESYARISVTDTGIGIKPEFLPHVFTRFSQADGSVTRAHGGLGMGLSIVKSIVELHGGDVSVSSPGEGMGATFTVKIPMSDASARTGDEAAAAQAQAFPEEPVFGSHELAGLKLLVVDDEKDTCEMLSFLLERYGAQVQTATSAMDALALLKVWNPDVLVCDIGMPMIDGYELIRRVRADETLQSSRVPAVALTALARIEDRVKALSAGYQMHVAKPVEPVELVTMIASVASLGRRSD